MSAKERRFGDFFSSFWCLSTNLGQIMYILYTNNVYNSMYALYTIKLNVYKGKEVC